MAYEEKRTSDESIGLEPILKLMRQLINKWWLIVAFVCVFAIAGFSIAKITYKESYTSGIIFNVSNKDGDMVGAAGTYITASDAQASTYIANNFKVLIQSGNDFITKVQDIVETTTGEKEYPRSSSGGKCEVKTTTGDIEITFLLITSTPL